MRFNRIRHLLAATALAALAACGGGDAGGSSGLGGNTGGTATGTDNVVVTGTITGFGSVLVGGTRFETSGATISNDGQSVTQQALRVGQMVQIQGRVDRSSGRATADVVRRHDILEGPIASIDAAAQTFVILAHTVRITADTSFDDSLGAANISSLTVGLQVEVSGTPNASGDIVATRIEKRRAGETTLEIIGKVSALNATTHKFNIDKLVVDYTNATLDDFGSAGIANDQLVEAKGATVNAAGELVATRVERRNFERHDSATEFRRELEGLVTRFVSATDFDVAGRKVTTTATTVYEGGTIADLALNVKLEAKGAIDANGVLVATKIEFKRGGSAGLAGRVDAITPGANEFTGTVTILGVAVAVDNTTRMEDKSDARIEMFRISNLAVGDFVRVRGSEDGPLKLKASRLERRRAPSSSGDAYVRGTVRDVARPNLTILGVPVVTNSSTEFEEVSADQFFATANGRIVAAKGTETNNSITAREVEFEDHDD
jgi:Domain of unknown function (DUF5666)